MGTRAMKLRLGLVLVALVVIAGMLAPAMGALAADRPPFPPPPSPGWQYGTVGYSVKYETWPAPYYRVTFHIKSPANIWFRYLYTTGPGKRAYYVTSGHQTKLFRGCIGVQAFGVNLSKFGPMTTRNVQWRAAEKSEKTQSASESAASSSAK